ncbi:MAG: hypothetical protein Fur002_21390 [Anaerolineales bacterium]
MPLTQTRGWIAGRERGVETYAAQDGLLLRVEGGGEYLLRAGAKLPDGERDIIYGPVIVLAQALQNVWSLHASAALHGETLIAFLGESGAGKSTLSAYLGGQRNWRRAADDILAVKLDAAQLVALPRLIPQLKLTAPPARALPEFAPLRAVCLIQPAEASAEPTLTPMSAAQTAQALLAHTAGTRMFPPELLQRHLEFCAQAAPLLQGYALTYPHRQAALPKTEELLEML